MFTLYNETQDICSSCGKEIKGIVCTAFKAQLPLCCNCKKDFRDYLKRGFSVSQIYHKMIVEKLPNLDFI